MTEMRGGGETSLRRYLAAVFAGVDRHCRCESHFPVRKQNSLRNFRALIDPSVSDLTAILIETHVQEAAMGRFDTVKIHPIRSTRPSYL